MDKKWTRQNFKTEKKRRDFSSQDYYRDGWVNKNRKKKVLDKKFVDKIDLKEEFEKLSSSNFSWINNCVL